MTFLVAYRLTSGEKHIGEVTEADSHEQAAKEVRAAVPGVRTVLTLVTPMKESA